MATENTLGYHRRRANNRLFRAIEVNDAERIKEALEEHGANPNSAQGKTGALFIAATREEKTLDIIWAVGGRLNKHDMGMIASIHSGKRPADSALDDASFAVVANVYRQMPGIQRLQAIMQEEINPTVASIKKDYGLTLDLVAHQMKLSELYPKSKVCKLSLKYEGRLSLEAQEDA